MDDSNNYYSCIGHTWGTEVTEAKENRSEFLLNHLLRQSAYCLKMEVIRGYCTLNDIYMSFSSTAINIQ